MTVLHVWISLHIMFLKSFAWEDQSKKVLYNYHIIIHKCHILCSYRTIKCSIVICVCTIDKALPLCSCYAANIALKVWFQDEL